MARPFDSNDRVGGYDFSYFAQEFLRRNSSYRQQYARIASASGFDAQSPACRRMARSSRCIDQSVMPAVIRFWGGN